MRLWGVIIVAALAPLTLGQLPTGFTDTQVVPGLALPTGLTFLPDGRLLILEKSGIIRLYKNNALQAANFGVVNCDVTSGRGLLGAAADPSFATNHFLYLYYTAGTTSLNPPPTPKNRVSRFTVTGDSLEPGSELILVDGIPSDSGSDNGGSVRFGADGKLYISTGDGGITHTNSQDLGSLGGKLLRIQPGGQIPADNPFVGVQGARQEVWALGLRNPFRFNFRPGTSVPYIADNGDHTWEEINIGVSGGNFGWPTYEGPTNQPGFISPTYYYNHDGGSRSIIAGPFGKSDRWPVAYANRFLFADYKLNQLSYLEMGAANQLLGNGTFGPTANGPVDFAFGPDGALYYTAILEHAVHKIAYRPSVASVAAPSDVDGGTTVMGTVTLNAVAPVGRQSVSLSSTNPALASVPTSITVAPDSLTQTFPITTHGVLVPTTVTIRASLGVTASTTIVLHPNGIAGLYAASPTVPSGGSLKFTVALLHLPLFAAVVALQSSTPALATPSSITLDAGLLSKGFFTQAAPVGVATSATITATWCGISKSKTVTITPAVLADLLITPNPILSGTSGTGQVVLSAAAAPGGTIVTTFDNTSLIETPPSVTVPAGSTSQSFAFSTVHVTVTATRTVSAKLGAVTKTVTITLLR